MVEFPPFTSLAEQQDPSVCTKASEYIAELAPHIAGVGDRDQIYHAACLLSGRFELSPNDAWPILVAFNSRCEPPATKQELFRKFADAFKSMGAEFCEEDLYAQLPFPEQSPLNGALLRGSVGQGNQRQRRRRCNVSGARILPRPTLDGMRALTYAETVALWRLKKISLAGIRYAARKGFLFACHWGGVPCFAVKDSSRYVIAIQRFDGQHYPRQIEYTTFDQSSFIVPGSELTVPLGMREAGAVEHIALVQSIPDFLYAHGRVMSENAEARVAVIAVLCASENIDEATWRAFKGKTVRIFPQNSETGLKAAERWWQQIADFDASKVDVFKLPDLKKADGTPVRELCDLAGMSPEQLDSDPKLRRILP